MSQSAAENRDRVDDYLFGVRHRTSEDFGQANAEDMSEAVCSLGGILSLHMILFLRGADILGRRFEAFAVLRTALDTLVSALHLARHRANIDVACLLRSAVEAGCTAFHISRDAEAWESFIKGTYRSTSSISAVKAEIPLVGKVWGALSQAAVHVNGRGHGPRWQRDSEDGDWVPTIEFNFHMRRAETTQDKVALTLICLASEIVACAQEFALLEEDPSHPGWRRVPGTSMIFSSNTARRIEELHERFLRLTRPAPQEPPRQ